VKRCNACLLHTFHPADNVAELRSLDDDDDELEGIWQAALEGAQQSREPEAVRSADLSALVRRRPGFRFVQGSGCTRQRP
jgi:hypothetical protein